MEKVKRTMSVLWPPIIILIVGLSIWYSASHFAGLPRYILPSPELILFEGIEKYDSLLRNGWVTFVEAAVGFTIGVFLAVCVALVLVTWRFVDRGASPYLVVGLKVADRREVELFSVLSASRFKELFKLRVPSSLPFFFASLRVASAAAVLAAVVAEFIQSSEGLGYLILTAAYTSNTPRIWAAVAVSASIALFFYALVTYAERKIIPWHSSVDVR